MAKRRNTDMDTETKQNGTSAIDRALAAAKARKAAKDGDPGEPVKGPPRGRPRKDGTDAELRRAAKAAALAEEAARKAARKAEREAKRAAKASVTRDLAGRPAHMKKVEAARARCPSLAPDAERLYGEVTANLPAAQVDALAQHLLVHVRTTRTLRAMASRPLPLGASVRIIGGEPKYIGMTGQVIHAQKLRAKVSVPGVKKTVYIYTGEAEVISAGATAATA